jgi:plasmid stabilization system protein ParE
MPQVTLRPRAREGVARCRRFLAARNRFAAKDAAAVIDEKIMLLKTMPDIGTPHPIIPGLRELKIAFGDSGYVALYVHSRADDAVYVVNFKHQKEGGY